MPDARDFLDVEGRWRCTGCGNCCRMLWNQNLRAWPELRGLDRGDGTCRFLDAASRCMIYETRPAICRIDQTRDPMTNAEHCVIVNRVHEQRLLSVAGGFA